MHQKTNKSKKKKKKCNLYYNMHHSLPIVTEDGSSASSLSLQPIRFST